MHLRLDHHARRRLLVGGVLLAGCFDPEIASNDTDVDASGSTGDTGPVETTLETTAPTGTLTGDTTTAPSTTDPTADSSTGPGCVDDRDCPAGAECMVVTCEDGTCIEAPAEAGTACGDDTVDDCTAADSCDADGACVANHAADGATCSGCELGVCSCTDGACGDCTFAPSNEFTTARSIEGWTLTGGWALYREIPQNQLAGSLLFDSQVLGTDGNRSQPYPGGEQETSTATSTPTVLPAVLELSSWHLDEGSGNYDNKAILVSVDDGASWTSIADCVLDPSLAFCVPRGEREVDDWDGVAIPIPADMIGELGLVQLSYASGDACCGSERGWYVDSINLATECACADDEGCAAFGGECGAGVCGASGACELAPVGEGTACGDAGDVECDAPDACDAIGYCLTHVATTGLTTCSDCPSGAGACNVCQTGVCNDCASPAAVNDFSTGIAALGWVAESVDGTASDWRVYFQAPPDLQAGSTFIGFGGFGNVFGTDGNRAAPYDAMVAPNNQHTENSRVTTTPDIVPSSITFASWHVDEGNNVDNKTIELSVDDGATWNVLVDCNDAAAQAAFPFCVFRNDDRAGDAWDSIAVDSSAYAGLTGRLRFTYTTQDSCCDFERGWYVDNLAFAQYCLDPQFP